MAVAGQGAGKEVEQQIEDENLVAEMYKYGGAFSLVGLEFFYKAREDLPATRIRLDGLLKDGESYRAKDVRTDRPMEDAFHPRELTVGKGTRGGRDPVIKLMRSLKMNPEAYLDPLALQSNSGLGEFITPETRFAPRVDERRTSAPLQHTEHERGAHAGYQSDLGGRGRSMTPMQRPATAPAPRYMTPPYGPPKGMHTTRDSDQFSHQHLCRACKEGRAGEVLFSQQNMKKSTCRGLRGDKREMDSRGSGEYLRLASSGIQCKKEGTKGDHWKQSRLGWQL
jgi:hypothetical protein